MAAIWIFSAARGAGRPNKIFEPAFIAAHSRRTDPVNITTPSIQATQSGSSFALAQLYLII